MSKPLKGNKTKRPPSDEARLKRAHINNLKREVAIVSTRFSIPDGFKVTSVGKSKVRIKGPGAQAIKLSNAKNKDEVVKAVANREWNRVAVLIPREVPQAIDYKNEVKEVTQTK